MNFEFLQYVGSDQRELTDMVFALYSEDVHGEQMSEEKIGRTIASFEEQPERGGIIMFRFDSETVGYAIIIPCWSNEFGGTVAIVDELYVKPVWRRQGCMRQFLAFLSGSHSGEIVALQMSVSLSNELAQKCYEASGFINRGNSIWVRPDGA